MKYLYQECLNKVIQSIEYGQEPREDLVALTKDDLYDVYSQDMLEDATKNVVFPVAWDVA